jgi:hypothetical protein
MRTRRPVRSRARRSARPAGNPPTTPTPRLHPRERFERRVHDRVELLIRRRKQLRRVRAVRVRGSNRHERPRGAGARLSNQKTTNIYIFNHLHLRIYLVII